MNITLIIRGVTFGPDSNVQSAEHTINHEGIAVLKIHFGEDDTAEFHSENYTALDNARDQINQAIADGGGTTVIIDDL